MPSKPVLSHEDKARIKCELLTLCEQLWIAQGYKKTSIKQLCQKANIAIGTFYALFPTKEDVFLQTCKAIQIRLKDQFMITIRKGKKKASLAEALKELYREFDRKPFLYDVNSPDFTSFVTKLSKESMEEITFESIAFFKEMCQIAGLKSKVQDSEAYGILSALLATITTKDILAKTCDYLIVFDFMVDTLIDQVFE